jgi:hypothetical protein
MNEQQRAVVQQALEALDTTDTEFATKQYYIEHEAMKALHQLLEAETEPVQEPETCSNCANAVWPYGSCDVCTVQFDDPTTSNWEPITTPPAQPAAWVGLTDDEILEAAGIDGADTWLFETAYAIDAKLREKNGGAA